MPGKGRPKGSNVKKDANGVKEKKVKEETTIALGVEHAAASGWACCKKCNEKFPLNQLRVYYVELDKAGKPQTSKLWHHLQCMKSVKTQPWRAKISMVPAEQINGFPKLGENEKAAVRAMLKSMEGEEAAHNKPVSQGKDHGSGSDEVHEGRMGETKSHGEDEQEEAEAPEPTTHVDKEDEKEEEAEVAEPPTDLDAAVLEEAKRLKLHGKLKTLAGNPEIAKLALTASQVLGALKAASGSVVKAKKALRGT